MNENKCKIESVEDSSTNCPAKILNFQNGQLNNPSNVFCKILEDEKNKKQTIAVATERCLYVGEENESENDSYYTMLAVRNLETNKVQLFPINSVMLKYMIEKPVDNEDSTEKQKILNDVTDKMFGSKQKIRSLQQKKQMKLNVSTVEDELRKSVANVTINASDFNSITAIDIVSDFTPKINRNADTVDEVYDLDSIIAEYDRHSFNEHAEQILNNNITNKQLTGFVLDCINKLKQKSIDDKEKIEILLFCDAILKFFKLPIKNIKKKVVIGDYPVKIVNKIVDDYTVTVNNIRSRPISMREKAASVLIVLSLIAMNYKIDLKALSNELNVALKKMQGIARFMGAQPLSKNKNMIILKLPLPSPIIPNKSNKRK